MIYAASFCIYWRFLLQTFKTKNLAKARKLIDISRVRVCSVAMEPSSKRSKLEMWTPSLSSEEATPGLVTLGVWFDVFCFHRALKKLKGGILVVAFLLKVFCWWSIHIYSFLEIWRNLKKYICTQLHPGMWHGMEEKSKRCFFFLGWCFSEHHM